MLWGFLYHGFIILTSACSKLAPGLCGYLSDSTVGREVWTKCHRRLNNLAKHSRDRVNMRRNRISKIKFFQPEDEVISGVLTWKYEIQRTVQQITAKLSTILISFRSDGLRREIKVRLLMLYNLHRLLVTRQRQWRDSFFVRNWIEVNSSWQKGTQLVAD
jgi:hypothetical protein